MSRIVLVSLILATVLAGCGRKGELDAPGVAAAPPASSDPGAQPPPAPAKVDKPFFLDALI